MNELPIIVSPLTAGWPVWLILLLIAMSLVIYSHNRRDLFRTVLLVAHRWIGMSLALFLFVYRGECMITHWFTILAMTAAADIVQITALETVLYTFEIHDRDLEPADRYNQIWYAVSVAVLPFCIIDLHIPESEWLWIGWAVVTTGILVVLLVRNTWRVIRKPSDIASILLYLMTAEVLPLALLVYAVQHWI